MLYSLSLESFRSWEDRTTLRLGQLTLLAGPNNAGKSSFLGGLKALIQSEQVRSKDELLLSGEWVDLGSFDQLLPAVRRGGSFSVGLTGKVQSTEIDAVWDFAETADPSKEVARVARIEAQLGQVRHTFEAGPQGLVKQEGSARSAALLADPTSFFSTTGEIISLLPYRAGQIQSVGSFRAPPERGVYVQRRNGGGPAVGKYGEHAAELAWNQGSRDVHVLPPDGAVEDEVDGFERAINRWYSFVLGHRFDLRVEEIRRFGYKVLIGTSAAEDLTFSQVGFGLSQIWPIVVASLASKREELVLVETPEAHLHPAAQHRLARLFVELARSGRQVIVETHSEHILAAVCLGIKADLLKPEQVAVHFVQQREGQSDAEEIPIDAQGRRGSLPGGFFDQSSIELLELLR